jgi:hypothetical protein
MTFHWIGESAKETGVVVLQAGLDFSHPFIPSAIVIGWVLVLGAFIRSGVRNKRRLHGTSIEQLLAAHTDQVSKSYTEWSLPPELNIPTPRPIANAPLGDRLARGLARLLGFLALVIGSFAFLCLILYGMQVAKGFHALMNFLWDPHWHDWMFWPTAIYGAIAAWMIVSGYIKHRKERKLLQCGTATRAVATATAFRGRRLWTFEYSDFAGNLVRSRGTPSRAPEQGSGVMTVLYDPDRPQVFVCYPGTRYVIGGAIQF